MSEEYSKSRRQFIGYAIGGVAGVVSLGYAVPIINYIVSPSLSRPEPPWSQVGKVDDLVVDRPVSLRITEHEKIGWQDKSVSHDIWVVKSADGMITAFSPVCPHLGCGYRWDQETGQFVCPCHLSMFDIKGTVLGGPAPRNLDTLDTKVEDGVLHVKYEKFRLGVTDKVVA